MLQGGADAEIERLKHALEVFAIEHQVRFSNLHAKRAEVIAEIYDRIVDAEQYGQKFVFTDAFAENSNRQNAYQDTHRKLIELYYLVEKRRIYLPENIGTLLQTFVDKVRRSVVGSNIYTPIEPSANPQVDEKRVQVMKEVFEAFESSIPAARKALETEFRAILGGES